MLTERGWAMAGAALALLVLWALFGEIELGVGGLLLAMAVVAAAAFVAIHRPRLTISRRIGPALVHEGQHAAVTLVIDNGSATSRHVSILDEVAGLGIAEFAIAAVERGGHLTATYRILCRPRGVYPIGPTEVGVTDPFGLAATRIKVGPADPLVVFPAVEDLTGYPGAPGRNLAFDARRPEHNQRGGEDFYTLREYQLGDDLRRVHWPSSARRDVLMIRQLETPWQARALIVLDVRSQVYEDEACFEHAVRGAASVVRHLTRGGFAADVWVGGGVVDAARYVATMEALALVRSVPDFDLQALGSRLRRTDGGGALILVGGNADHTLLGVQRMLAATFPSTVLLSASTTTSSTLLAFQRAGVATVISRPDDAWAPAWRTAMSRTWQPV